MKTPERTHVPQPALRLHPLNNTVCRLSTQSLSFSHKSYVLSGGTAFWSPPTFTDQIQCGNCLVPGNVPPLMEVKLRHKAKSSLSETLPLNSWLHPRPEKVDESGFKRKYIQLLLLLKKKELRYLNDDYQNALKIIDISWIVGMSLGLEVDEIDQKWPFWNYTWHTRNLTFAPDWLARPNNRTFWLMPL